MSTQSNKQQLQAVEKKMLRQFHEFCQNEQLTYYALGGTLLGAIRHKGFIPWDDDIDVGLPRASYDKLCRLVSIGHTNALVFLQNSFQLQIVDNNGAIIDVFALDGVPESVHHQNELFSWTKKQKTRCNIADINNTLSKDRGVLKNSVFQVIKWSGVSKIFNKQTENQRINDYLRQYTWENERYVANVLGRYQQKEIVEKRIFGEPTLYPFEDLMIYGPEDADSYLTHIYGDYMTIPKEYEQYSNE